jgi:acid phosphatase
MRLAPRLTIAMILACMGASRANAAAVPPLDHVIVVVLENHSYSQALAMPYLRSLADSFVSFLDSRAVTHPSQPNYLAMWAGSTLGVTSNVCPAPGSPFYDENLGHACEAAGITWRAYSEDLPFAGSDTCETAGFLYARKHEPWTHFDNLTHLNERPYADLAVDIANDSLPRLAFVVPNQCNDGHDCPLSVADAWLAANVPMMRAAVGPGGVVIITWDEDDGSAGNRILTVVCGAPVKQRYVSVTPITHYTLLRTICDAIGIAPFAAAAAESAIGDIWAEEHVSVQEPGASTIVSAPPIASRTPWVAHVRTPGARRVQADVTDTHGRRVRRLFDGVAGSEQPLRWAGTTESGGRVPRGIYVLRITDGLTTVAHRFVYLAP